MLYTAALQKKPPRWRLFCLQPEWQFTAVQGTGGAGNRIQTRMGFHLSVSEFSLPIAPIAAKFSPDLIAWQSNKGLKGIINKHAFELSV